MTPNPTPASSPTPRLRGESPRRTPPAGGGSTLRKSWTEAEIAAELEGKFFLLDGRDKHELARLDRENQEAFKAKIRECREQRIARTAAAIATKQAMRSGVITAEQVVLAVATAHDLTPADIKDKTRRVHIVHARHHACVLLREFTELSTPSIAHAVGLTDQSTAHHAIKTWPRRGHVYAKQDAEARRLLGVSQ